MKTWRRPSPLMKALLISCFIHGLFAVALLGQLYPITVSPETTELYEMDLTQPTPSETELPDDNVALTNQPDTTSGTPPSEFGQEPPREPQKSAVITPVPLPNPANLVRSNQPKPNTPVVTKRNIRTPTIIKTINPQYPAATVQEKQPFKLTLMVEISESGQPSVVTVIASSGSKELDDAAMLAIKQWVFSPAIDLTTGKPVLFLATIDLNYPVAKNNLSQLN
jgi:TonB family protein